MSSGLDSCERRDRLVAGLLRYGTWLASATIALGMLVDTLPGLQGLSLFGLGGSGLVRAGVALFIILPVTRVAMLLVLFLQERDYIYTAISALVLTIIAAGVIIEA